MYSIFLANIQLPVAPSKITMKTANSNKTMELINGSEINFLRTPGLTEFSFDFLIPHTQYVFAVYADGFNPQSYYMEALEKFKTDKKPFKFGIMRTLPNGKVLFNTLTEVSLEDYSVNESASEGFDLVASVKLKQFNPIKTTTQTVIKKTEAGAVVKEETVRPISKETPKSYTVKSGDTLWAICKSNLGDGAKYGEIAKLNGISNPNLIYPGQVIRFG